MHIHLEANLIQVCTKCLLKDVGTSTPSATNSYTSSKSHVNVKVMLAEVHGHRSGNDQVNKELKTKFCLLHKHSID